jgi:hypothetical protein
MAAREIKLSRIFHAIFWLAVACASAVAWSRVDPYESNPFVVVLAPISTMTGAGMAFGAILGRLGGGVVLSILLASPWLFFVLLGVIQLVSGVRH